MSRKDVAFFAFFLALLAAVTARILLLPGLSFGNFGDIYAYHFPLRELASSTLQQGRLPLWDPYIFCGTPLLANPQAALFDPLSVLFYFLPALKAFDWNTVLRLMLAYLGAFLLCRRWRLPSSGAFAMGSAFALSPFLVYRVAQGVPTLLAALAFVPWTWLALEAENAPLFAGALALQLLSGHPQFMVINLAGCFPILLLRRPRALAPYFIGGAAAALATAGQWLPTLQFLSLSVRTHWVPMYATAYSWEPRFLLDLLLPRALGTPFSGNFRGVPSEFFEMSGLYLGVIPLALALWGFWRGGGARTFALLAAAGLFIAFGANNPVLSPLLERPGLGSLRVPSRWLLLALWGLWAGGCAGWLRFSKRFPGGKRAQAALALLVLIDLLPWDGRFLYAQDPLPFIAPDHTLSALLDEQPERFATSPDIQNPDKALLYRLRNVTGYEAFYLAGAALEASQAQGKPSADGSRTYIEDYLAPGFNDAALRYYVTPAKAKTPPPGNPVLETAASRIYEDLRAQPLAFHEGSPSPDPDAPGFESPDAEDWVLKETVPPGSPALILSQAYYPGWKAWIGDSETAIEPWQGFFQRVAVQAAPGQVLPVRLRFDPGLWWAALALSAAALAAAAAWLIRGLSALSKCYNSDTLF